MFYIYRGGQFVETAEPEWFVPNSDDWIDDLEQAGLYAVTTGFTSLAIDYLIMQDEETKNEWVVAIDDHIILISGLPNFLTFQRKVLAPALEMAVLPCGEEEEDSE